MLNPQQAAAVRYVDGPLLVLAGAGSGKTRVITQKIAYLIERLHYKPWQILAVTFTNKAAHEMRTRVAQTLPAEKRRGMQVATFHTLGLNILKRHADYAGLKKGFSILDQDDCLTLIRDFLPKSQASDRDYLFLLQTQISRWKNAGLSPEDLTDSHFSLPIHQEAYPVYQRYQHILKAYNALDFDDLIALPVRLLREHEPILNFWQNKIRHLLVDEYQDSNASQYELVKHLVGVRAQFTVVGDDDQSIYAWRGARPENLAQLQEDFPNLNVIKLEQNYRSSGRILFAANQLIANNPHLFTKALWSALGPGDMPRVIYCQDEEHEAEQIVSDLVSHKLRTGREYGDYAILYRGNHQSRLFEKVLRDHGIAYQLSGGQSWFARKEVKDIFAYLKLLANPADDAAFLRAVHAPKRGIGEASIEALVRYAHTINQSLFVSADHLALSEHLAEKPRQILAHFKTWLMRVERELSQQRAACVEILKRMVIESGYESYLYETCETPARAEQLMDHVNELLMWVGRLLNKDPDASLADVMNKLMLIDLLDKVQDNSQDKIQLLTLHAAKGLEFPFVYLSGLEEGILPHRISVDEGQIEEERRLFYVGITRAQQGLCLTLARKRRTGGEQKTTKPSRFLDELPESGFEWYGFGKAQDDILSKQIANTHLAALKKMLS